MIIPRSCVPCKVFRKGHNFCSKTITNYTKGKKSVRSNAGERAKEANDKRLGREGNILNQEGPQEPQMLQ